MSEPFLAEIRLFGFNFAPRGWAFCDGQLLPINQNQSLYSLLGTTYGGDGRTPCLLTKCQIIPMSLEPRVRTVMARCQPIMFWPDR
jgi:microcystin-dependent protein